MELRDQFAYMITAVLLTLFSCPTSRVPAETGKEWSRNSKS